MSTDKERLDWLEEQIVHTINLDDGTILETGGGNKSVRDVIDEQLSAAEERAYDRQQETLMEGGGSLSLLDQQKIAYKLKHGYR